MPYGPSESMADVVAKTPKPKKSCEFCGHDLMPMRQKPLEGMDPSSDSLVHLCVVKCFCSHGGCKPEREAAN